MTLGFGGSQVRCIAIVHGHYTFVRNHIARHSTVNGHRMQAFTEAEPIDHRLPCLVCRQTRQQLTCRVNGVIP